MAGAFPTPGYLQAADRLCVLRRRVGLFVLAGSLSIPSRKGSAGQTVSRVIPEELFSNARFISIIVSVRIWQNDGWRYISGGSVTDARAIPGGVLDVDFDIQGLVISTARQNFKIRLSSLSRLHLIPQLIGKGEPLPHGDVAELSRDLYVRINLSVKEHRRHQSAIHGSDIDLELRWNYVLHRQGNRYISHVSEERSEFARVNSYDLTSFILSRARESIIEVFRHEFVVD